MASSDFRGLCLIVLENALNTHYFYKYFIILLCRKYLKESSGFSFQQPQQLLLVDCPLILTLRRCVALQVTLVQAAQQLYKQKHARIW